MLTLTLKSALHFSFKNVFKPVPGGNVFIEFFKIKSEKRRNKNVCSFVRVKNSLAPFEGIYFLMLTSNFLFGDCSLK